MQVTLCSGRMSVGRGRYASMRLMVFLFAVYAMYSMIM